MMNASERIQKIETQITMLTDVIKNEMQKWEDLEVDAQVKLPNYSLPDDQGMVKKYNFKALTLYISLLYMYGRILNRFLHLH